MMPILNKIGDSNFDERLKKPLVKYLIITNVSVIEDFASNLAGRIIDENDLDVDELIPDEAMPFIQNKSLTKGQVVAISYSFANLAQMDFVYSKMLGFSFLDYILRVSKEDPYREIKGATILHKNWKHFEQMFEIRNDIVHAMKDPCFSERGIISLCENTISFMDIASALRIDWYRKELAAEYSTADKSKKQLSV